MEWLLRLPAPWMGFIIFAISYLIAAVVFWSTTRLTGAALLLPTVGREAARPHDLTRR